MPKRLLTEQQQLTGVTRALETLQRKKKKGQPCPYWLIPSLEKRKRDLEDKLRGGRRLWRF